MGVAADVELLFGVMGGGSISGASGQKISNQLSNIVGSLNKSKAFGLKFEIDQKSLKTFKERLKAITDLKDDFKGFTVPKSFNGLSEFINSVAKITPKKAEALTGLDLSKFNNLNVKKTSLNNLATYLPKLEAVNVKKLKDLSDVDFSKFSNLTINKSAMASLSEIKDLMALVDELKKVNLGEVVNVNSPEVTAVRETQDLLTQMKKKTITNLGVSPEDKKSVEDLNKAYSDLGKAIGEVRKKDAAGEDITSDIQSIRDQQEALRQLIVLIDQRKKAEKDSRSESIKSANDLLKDMNKQRTSMEKFKGYDTNQSYSSLTTYIQSTKDAINQFKNGTIDLDTFRDRLDQLRAGYDQNTDAVKRYIETASKEKIVLPESKEYNDRLAKSIDLLRQITDAQDEWTKAKNGKGSVEYKNLEGFRVRLEEIRSEFEKTGNIAKYDTQISKLTSDFKQSGLAIHQAGEDAKGLGDRFKDLISKFSTFFDAYQVIMRLVRYVKEMVATVTELDNAFTQLKIVTNANDYEMESFLSNSIRLAKELGKSVSEITGSIEVFSRLGYNLEESSILAEYASILSNVANVDISEATAGITSIVKGFNMDVEDAEHVADVLVEVGQKYAVSASEMMEAYEKSGAALNATNTSFEKSAGLIAAANAAVQDAGVVGRFVPSIAVM